jgi:hypothetical protein
MMQGQCDEGCDWVDGVTIAAPGFLGAAAGLLLGELMHSSARRGVAIGLIGLGVAALVPAAVEGVRRRVNDPGTKRGSRRRLRGIRDAGGGTASFSFGDDPFAADGDE